MVRVKDGKVFHIRIKVEIPREHIAYQKIPEDGFYTTSEATCGGKCSIGVPKLDCIGRCYSEQKCAVLWLEPI